MKTLAVLAFFTSLSALATDYRCETKFDIGAAAFGAARISFSLELSENRAGAVGLMRNVVVTGRNGVDRLGTLTAPVTLTESTLAAGVEFEGADDSVLLVVEGEEFEALRAGQRFEAEVTFSAVSLMSGNSTREVICRP